VIDFRYHLVSIIAVFLALAVGLLVGVTALPGESITVLQRAERVAEADNKALSAANKQLSLQVAADQALAQAGSQRQVGGLLPGRKVVLIVAPNASNAEVTGLTAALAQAGATVTGQIDLTQQFVQTAGAQGRGDTACSGFRPAGSRPAGCCPGHRGQRADERRCGRRTGCLG
jgi:hypothetical protein